MNTVPDAVKAWTYQGWFSRDAILYVCNSSQFTIPGDQSLWEGSGRWANHADSSWKSSNTAAFHQRPLTSLWRWYPICTFRKTFSKAIYQEKNCKNIFYFLWCHPFKIIWALPIGINGDGGWFKTRRLAFWIRLSRFQISQRRSYWIFKFWWKCCWCGSSYIRNIFSRRQLKNTSYNYKRPINYLKLHIAPMVTLTGTKPLTLAHGIIKAKVHCVCRQCFHSIQDLRNMDSEEQHEFLSTSPMLNHHEQIEFKEFIKLTLHDDHFIFPGYVPMMKIFKTIYKHMLCNILISRDEGFGLVYLESATQAVRAFFLEYFCISGDC